MGNANPLPIWDGDFVHFRLLAVEEEGVWRPNLCRMERSITEVISFCVKLKQAVCGQTRANTEAGFTQPLIHKCAAFTAAVIMNSEKNHNYPTKLRILQSKDNTVRPSVEKESLSSTQDCRK